MRMFWRFTMLAIGLALLPGAAAHAGPIEKPSIVFIMVDDMGWADLGCFGGEAIDTPNLDVMAREGMRFTDCYSGCVVCAPARCVLMTGKHMGHAAVRGNTGGIPLPAEEVTVAELLKQQGYAIGGFGKWGIGEVGTEGVPEKQGFDTFFGYYHQVHAHSFYTPYLWRNSQKVPLEGNAGGGRKTYSHNVIVDETLKFIRQNKDRPFFCYAPWTPPHGKYEFPEDDPAWAKFKDKSWPRDAKVIAAMDTMIDRNVGQVLALLKELKIDDRTIVFFCSDHGAAKRLEGTLNSCGPLKGFKRSVYEGGIRTPMIARWPGQIEAGAVSDHPWYFADVLPTFVELAGESPPQDIDGISVVPTLVGEKSAGHAQKMHDALYWEWARYNWSKGTEIPNGLMQAVRMGDWKVLRHGQDKRWEVYDLSQDIGEKNNLAKQQPDVIDQAEAWIAKNRASAPPQVEPKSPRGNRHR